MHVHVSLGNQLFAPDTLQHLLKTDAVIYMREDVELCTYYRFHKHKIILFLSAMRQYAKELEAFGLKVHYETLSESSESYESHLLHFLKSCQASRVSSFEVEDKFFAKRLAVCLKSADLAWDIYPSPMFLTSRIQFQNYLKRHRKPFMHQFYQEQRKRLKILLDPSGGPVGGKWSFDEQNRLPLNESVVLPSIKSPNLSSTDTQVMALVNTTFPHHPGHADNFWLSTSRKGAKSQLQFFLKNCLHQFGPYEDALSEQHDFIFHSVLTPYLNCGLLTPDEVIRQAQKHAESHPIPLASLEGFCRQVIGWREFVRGVYQNFSEQQESSNFFQHTRKLARCWYSGDTGVPPLDHVISKVNRLGYAHHIERLMVAGSLMVLLEVQPAEAHRWFMEMFVDSSDWVMGPNVYGMALFSDGGIFATKPYICGSNYYRKMGHYKKAAWCDAIDGLYWGFIEKHRAFFAQNPRLSMIVKTLDKLDKDRKQHLYREAKKLLNQLTEAA